VALGAGSAVAHGTFATLAAQTDFSFAAFLPGEYPGGETAEILNQRTGERISAPMLEGGLDPVGIPAEVGDVLEISILAGQTLLARMFRPVPERKPPVVVRTQPPNGKTKVPLNLSIGDLKQKFEVVSRNLLIECGGNGRAGFNPPASGNQWTYGAVANAEWTGVRMRDVLKAAGVNPAVLS